MDDVSDSSLRKNGLVALVRQGGGVVVIVEKLLKDYRKGAPRDVVAIERWMQFWCDGHDLPPERFKVNLRRKNGIRIDEFKAYQLRAYGFSRTVGDKKIFLVTATDIKKQEKADPGVLDRAERIAGKLALEINK